MEDNLIFEIVGGEKNNVSFLSDVCVQFDYQ
jgi:hypothetical protein